MLDEIKKIFAQIVANQADSDFIFDSMWDLWELSGKVPTDDDEDVDYNAMKENFKEMFKEVFGISYEEAGSSGWA